MALNCFISPTHDSEDQEKLLEHQGLEYQPPTQNDRIAYLPKTCIIAILKNLEYYEPFLHPMILTNRHWCRQVMPYLWQRPFSRAATAFADQDILARFLGIYLWDCKELKKMSKLFTSFIEFPARAPTFQYVTFLKEFAPLTIIQIVAATMPTLKFPRKIQKTSKLFFRHIFASKVALQNFVLSFPNDASLLEMILKNDPSWDIFQYPGSEKSLATLQSLKCDYVYNPPLLQSAHMISRNLTRLDVNFERHEALDFSKERADNLAHLIKAQNNLKYFRLGYCSGNEVNIILTALQSQRDTLAKVVFYQVDFWNCRQIFDILGVLQRLRSLNFLYCERLRGRDDTSENNQRTSSYARLEELLLQQTVISENVLEDFAKRTSNTLQSVKIREHRFAGLPDEFSLLVTSMFEKYNVRVVNGP